MRLCSPLGPSGHRGFGLVSDWFRTGFGLVSHWFRTGFGLVSDWFRWLPLAA